MILAAWSGQTKGPQDSYQWTEGLPLSLRQGFQDKENGSRTTMCTEPCTEEEHCLALLDKRACCSNQGPEGRGTDTSQERVPELCTGNGGSAEFPERRETQHVGSCPPQLPHSFFRND